MKISRSTLRPSRLAKFAVTCLVLSPAAFAASATWDGGAGTNVINTGSNWTGDAAPVAANDTATWDGTAPGNLALIWSSNFGVAGGTATTGGTNLVMTGAQTGSLSLDATGGNLSVGNITLNSGAGAFTLGDGSGTATIVLRGGSTFTNDSSTAATIRSDVSVLNGGGIGGRVISFGGSGNWAVENTLITAGFTNSGTASLSKSGAGTLTLSGANVHGAGTTVSGGALAVTHGGALGTGNVALSGGRLLVSNNINLGGVTNYNLTGSANVPGTSSFEARIVNVSGANAISGNINFSAVGGTVVNVHSAAGILTLNGNIAATLTTTTARTFNFAGAGDIISNGVISNGTVAVAVSKLGAGTFTVNGANTHTGGTTVTEGILSAGHVSALGTGDLAVNGGTLSSSVASVSDVGNVTFSSGGLDLGGVSVGALALASGKTFTMSGGTWSVSIGSTISYDQVTSAGGAAAFSVSDATIALSGISDYSVGYSLFSGFAPGSVSNLSITGYDSGSWLATLGTDGVLSFSAVPEPSAFACLAGLAALGLGMTRRRRQS